MHPLRPQFSLEIQHIPAVRTMAVQPTRSFRRAKTKQRILYVVVYTHADAVWRQPKHEEIADNQDSNHTK